MAKKIPQLSDFRMLPLGQMAKKLGISTSYLCNIEKGRKTPTNELYRKMLKEYGEPVKLFFYCKIVPVMQRRSEEELKELCKKMGM
jgi:transcriptional regulator with XRE-family HTH domain